MLYLIKSAQLSTESEDIFEEDKYRSVFKVGYAKEIVSRSKVDSFLIYFYYFVPPVSLLLY